MTTDPKMAMIQDLLRESAGGSFTVNFRYDAAVSSAVGGPRDAWDVGREDPEHPLSERDREVIASDVSRLGEAIRHPGVEPLRALLDEYRGLFRAEELPPQAAEAARVAQ